MVRESISPDPAMTTLQERDLLDYIKELRQHGQDGAAELLASLQTLYAEHYAEAWRTALSRLDIHRFEDLNHGVRILDSLTSGHQPLARLLAQVRDKGALKSHRVRFNLLQIT